MPGCVAELGVYRGETAALLNALLPDRDLYLFDTFCGFDAADLAQESGPAAARIKAGEFNDTSLELVLSRLPHPQRALPRPGRFPDTAAGLE